MTRKQLPFFIAFLVLLFGAMACACLGSGGGLGGFQATANAALTQAVGQGNSLSATANAAATEAIATANAAGGGNTSGGPTATTAAAAATTGSGGTGGTGGTSDVPLMTGDNSNVVTTSSAVAYQTKADSAAVVTFYKDAMPKNGWTADATKTVESSFGSVLAYTKDTRLALITIAKDPTGGGTTVAIAVQ